MQLHRTLVLATGLAACGGEAAVAVDAQDSTDDATNDAAIDTPPADVAADDFERGQLGSDWTVIFPPPPNDQVRIIGGSDLGMGPGPQGFFLVNYTARTFAADQFGEATIPTDVNSDWIHQVYVRWRASDRARYGFGYNGDPGQPSFGNWIFKYDGVPGPETRVFATAPAPMAPQPGDRIRVDGVPGLAARWANGNTSTTIDVKVWESWSGGSL